MTRKTSCPAGALAEKAARLIREYNTGDCAVGEQIIELEEAGTQVLAESRRGVEFQLGLLQAMLDDLVARIPEDAPQFKQIEERRAAIERLIWSAARFTHQGPPLSSELLEFFISQDPFVAH